MSDTTYDFPIPTINGQQITVDWLVNDPRRIYRLLRTLVQQRLISYRLLTGRVDLSGTGAGIYEISEAIFAKDDGEIVAPLAEYPQTDTDVSTLALVKPDKNGLKTQISDEQIAHNRIDIVLRKLIKIANKLVFQQDALALAAIVALVVKTQAAKAVWSGSTADPFLDVLLASAGVDEENQGYAVDAVATTPTLFAYAISRAVNMGILPREQAGNPVVSNINNIRIGNVTWLKTTNMPSGVGAIAADTTMLGSLAYERLGGGYQGDPSDMTSGVEVKRIRDDEVDGWTFQSRIVRAPMVQEPNSARILTGVSA